MLYISLCEMTKNWKRTLLMALQVGLILFLIIIAVTTYRTQSYKYNYLKNFFEKEGLAVEVMMSDINNYGGIENYVKNNLGAVDEYHFVAVSQFFLADEKDESLYFQGYDELISKYEPTLKAGKWYTHAKERKGVINIVVTGNEYSVGDTIELLKSDGTVFEAYVCGVLAEGGAYYQIDDYEYKASVFDFYLPFYLEKQGEEMPYTLVFASFEDMKEIGLSYTTKGRILFGFDENASDIQISRDKKKLANHFGMTEEFENIRVRSEDIIDTKLIEIIPVIMGAFLLITLSIVSLSAIDTLSSIESYAILYTCGMEWQNGVKIATIKSAVTCIISIFIMLLIRYASILIGFGDKYLFNFGVWQVLVCMLVCILMILVSSIMPSTILKKNQPVDILRDSKV